MKGQRRGPPPYGYRIKDGELVPHRQEQKTAELVREMHATGTMTLRAIADELNTRKVATRYGDKWHASVVRLICIRQKAA